MQIRATSFVAAIACILMISGTAAAQNLLVNPGFESPAFAGAEAPGPGDGWSPFGANFRIQGTPPIGPAGAHGGTVVLKVFGVSGSFQDFPAIEGETFDGEAWILNDSADPMANGQVAAVNIEWHGVGGQISFISNGNTTAASPQDVWTLQTVSGVAPPGTTTARFVVITGDFLPGGSGGAPRFDDARFARRGPVSVDPSTFGSTKALYRD